jgi:carbon monoxide dehydrogenase subunit G
MPILNLESSSKACPNTAREQLSRAKKTMMHFEGTKDLPLSAAAAWQKLSDARFLVRCIPDIESVSESQPGRAICTIRPGFAFVRGSLGLTLQVVEAVPESKIRLQAHTKGIGSSSDVEITLTLAQQGPGSRAEWRVEVASLGGLLKAIPHGLLQAAAQKVIADVWTQVETRLREEP